MNQPTDPSAAPGPHPHDDLAAYAIDALEGAERAAVEAHLAGCEACRHELDEHRSTLGSMGLPEAPPARIWEGISRAIHSGEAGPLPVRPAPVGTIDGGAVPVPPVAPAEGAPVATPGLPVPPVDPGTPGRPARPVLVPVEGSGSSSSASGSGSGSSAPSSGAARPWWRQGRVLAAAAAVLAVLGLAGAMVGLGGSGSGGGGGGGGVGPVAEQARAAVDDPGSTVVALTSATGEPAARVVVTDDSYDDDFVLLDRLAPLEADRTYQLWRTDGGAPVSLGVLGPGSDGAARVTLPEGVGSFAISDEPAGGSASPTDVVAT